MAKLLTFAAGACLAMVAAAQTTPLTGSHTNIPRWCGKPYMAGSPNYNPGGMLSPPAPQASQLLLVQIEPRHSIYVSSESKGELIVDAALSNIHGQAYHSSSSHGFSRELLHFSIDVNGQEVLNSVAWVNSTGNVYSFDLKKLDPRMQPYSVSLSGSVGYRNQRTFTATTELYYLPAKSSGSAVKIDNLNGGMLIANNVTKYAFEPILPFGFYTSCSGFLNYSLANVTAYADMGYTGINPVCSLADGDLSFLFDWLDMANLPFQYDMRGTYYNLTSIREQVSLIKDHSALLSWYTADEPDGWQYAFNSTTAAYALLKELDPYHPTGLVLNCDNYYFDQYTEGTDYIMEDAYPIGIDPTYSRPWNTTCNETYGDCGCDDCIGSLLDVSNRLDAFYEYQEWLGKTQKPLWAVQQAFSGEGYWSRDPTQMETWAMNLLAFNHRAKAIMSWTFPTSTLLEQAYSQMARIVTQAPVSTFLLGGQPTEISSLSSRMLDVSYWEHGGQIMVGLVNLDYSSQTGRVEIPLPSHVQSVASQPWGNTTWSVQEGSLYASGLTALGTSFVILDVESHSYNGPPRYGPPHYGSQ